MGSSVVHEIESSKVQEFKSWRVQEFRVYEMVEHEKTKSVNGDILLSRLYCY